MKLNKNVTDEERKIGHKFVNKDHTQVKKLKLSDGKLKITRNTSSTKFSKKNCPI